MTKLLLALLGMLAMTAVAAADPAESTPTPRDEDTATLLSLGGTAASGLLVLGGSKLGNSGMVEVGLLSAFVTPSLGEMYSGQYLTLGTGLRLGGAAAAIAGFATVFCWEDCSQSQETTGGVLMIAGAAAYVGGTIYDIWNAHHVAREYNVHHFHVAPTVMQTPSGTTAGVGIGGSF